MKQITMNNFQSKPVYYDRIRLAMVWWDNEAGKIDIRYSLGYEEEGNYMKTKEHQISLIGDDYNTFKTALETTNLSETPLEVLFLSVVNNDIHEGTIGDVV